MDRLDPKQFIRFNSRFAGVSWRWRDRLLAPGACRVPRRRGDGSVWHRRLAGRPRRSPRPAVQSSLAFATLVDESLVGLDDPGESVRRLPNRHQEAVAPAERRGRCNPAAHRCLADRFALGKRYGEGQSPLLAVKPGQRRAGESAEGATAELAAIAAQTARLAPGHRRCSSILSSIAANEAAPSVDPTEPQQPCGIAPPSVHRCSKTSPETAPDPLFRSPRSMQPNHL